MPEHSTIVHADTHEPKHITTSSTSDTGKIITPSGTSSGTSELRNLDRAELSDYFEHYGQQIITANSTALSLTAATDSTLQSTSDYTQVTGIFDAVPHGHKNGVTQQTNQLTVVQDGIYRIELYANTSSDATSTVCGFRFAIDGVIGVSRQPKHLMKTAGDINNAAAFGFISLSASEVVTLFIAADKTCNLTIEDAVFQLTLIQAL